MATKTFEMGKILDEQRKRFESTLAKSAEPQITLGFNDDERRQLDADKRHWIERIGKLDGERTNEPERIRASYEVRACRIEPVGLVYLWPVSG